MAPLLPFLSNATLAAELFDEANYLAETADRAVNVFDMQRVALSRWNQGHATYIEQGVEDELTLRANREGFSRLHLRAKRLVDVSQIDKRVNLFGQQLHSPILMAPVGGLGMAHGLGEVEAAHGASRTGHKMILSTKATYGIE
ncbi:MAG TPA: alpha-hydroxy-acid oxidizing protein, partial [Hyphomicrobiales bacterium]|nr:alpha-hydroxy-acid oxidizing protein [Hyphomicrobiales bacterium]